MSQPAIRCHNLSRRYGDIEALKPLNLEVPAGSIFGFLGRNGAGKSTAMRLLAGLARPSTGQAWIAGIETTQADSPARSQFGYLPQDPAFYSWMTAQEYLDYVGKLFQMDKNSRQQRIDHLLQISGLTEHNKRPIRGFSGGMLQRLGIAQAMLHNPPVLLLDEPTSALDPAGRYEVLSFIEGLRGQVTVFLSSHILADVERVCDTIGIIHQGELRLVAGRDELLARYAGNWLLIQLADESGPLVAPFVAELQTLPWLTAVEQQGTQLQLAVDDVVAAKQSLLPLLVQHGLMLERYEWTRPSLEQIFLQISE